MSFKVFLWVYGNENKWGVRLWKRAVSVNPILHPENGDLSLSMPFLGEYILQLFFFSLLPSSSSSFLPFYFEQYNLRMNEQVKSTEIKWTLKINVRPAIQSIVILVDFFFLPSLPPFYAHKNFEKWFCGLSQSVYIIFFSFFHFSFRPSKARERGSLKY